MEDGMSGWTLAEEQECLINIITWYRDEYHRMDWGHTQMIEEIRAITDVAQLEPYWQRTDDWLDCGH
jgi:hypothetical protein